MRRRRGIGPASRAAFVVASLSSLALASPKPSAEATEARREFVAGTEFVRTAKWAEAIEAFERAAAIAPHAVTSYNLGACERAMGHYTRARVRFLDALAQHEASGQNELSRELVGNTKAFLGELDRILVHVNLSVLPEGALITVDGRALALLASEANPPLLAAGLKPAGEGAPLPATTTDVVMDPGAHVVTVSLRGYRTAVENRTFSPGDAESMSIGLERLAASLHIDSNRSQAIVAVDGVDVGTVPVVVTRAEGAYRITVREKGFSTYETQVSLRAGEATRLSAALGPLTPSIFSRWWFWTAAGVVVAGAATATYALTRPEPPRPDVGGGTLGWSVALP